MTLYLGAASFSLLLALPARAEFPPQGAVADPTNPATATGHFPDPKHAGSLVRYVFYFDCGKRRWIGVAVADAKGGQLSAPSTLGVAHEFAPGPPPGAVFDTHDQHRAINHVSGRVFALREESWVDVKTGTEVKSPDLCANAPNVPPVTGKPVAAQDVPPPNQRTPAAPEPIGPVPKTDELPPPPTIITR